LRELVVQDEKERWKRVGQALGKSDVGCYKMAKEMGLAK
jgi:hypothetical protein